MNSTTSRRKQSAPVAVVVNTLTTIQIDWLIAQQEGVAVIFDGAHVRYALSDENELGAIYCENAVTCTSSCIRTEHPIATPLNSSCIQSEQRLHDLHTDQGQPSLK